MYDRQKLATKSLLEFCLAHDNETEPVRVIASCLWALKRADAVSGLTLFRSVPRGGMGTFNDWLPDPKSSVETQASAAAEFERLLSDWVDAFEELERMTDEPDVEPAVRFGNLLEELIGEPRVYLDRLDQILWQLRLMGDVVAEDLNQAIKKQFAEKNWDNLFRLIWSIPWDSPSKIFTPVLCEILEEGLEHGIAETVVDALDNIADPRSISALARTLDHYEPGDDDRHLNRKIVYAL